MQQYTRIVICSSMQTLRVRHSRSGNRCFVAKKLSFIVLRIMCLAPQQQIDRLKKQIAECLIEVADMFLDMSEMAEEVMLEAPMQPLKE
jgi:hypothetical protein